MNHLADTNSGPAQTVRPRIALTTGDPAGIGPEVVLKAVTDSEVLACCQPIIVGDAAWLVQVAETLGLNHSYAIVRRGTAWPKVGSRPLFYDLPNLPAPPEYGVESGIAGKASAEYIEAAVELCAAGVAQAISTAPINKRSLFLGGYNFPGHTEFLAHLSGTEEYAMAFVAGNLRIVLLSTHIPLAQAIQLIERERLVRVISLTQRELLRWGLSQPHIAVAALNPHGGEGGLFGLEEAAEMLPAIRECQAREGFTVSGPYSADTVFLRAAKGEFAAVIACYHDQAMISIKCLSFGEAVNVTLGLPFVRTSVDHGTAFDIAGQGIAEHSSMVAAIKLAAELAARPAANKVRAC